MRPLSEFPSDSARGIRFLLTDIDDTLTRDGRLADCAYSALWKARDAGLAVIPVTGRPAGWCDLIVRQWPVEAVIGENGAFACFLDGRRRKTVLVSPKAEPRRLRLDAVRDAVLAEVPGSRVADDQFCRLYDLAIDFNEQEPPLGLEAARRIQAVGERFGATAKISSIHVNLWFGDYDKTSMALSYLNRAHGLDETAAAAAVAFCGDSPNDEPMFARFPLSFGVANVRSFLPLMAHPPAYVSALPHGEGFAEIVEAVLNSMAELEDKGGPAAPRAGD